MESVTAGSAPGFSCTVVTRNSSALLLAQRAGNHFRSVLEYHLAGRNAAYFTGGVLIDLVTQREVAKHVAICFWAKVDWLQHDLIEMTIPEPPCGFSIFGGSVKKRLRGLPLKWLRPLRGNLGMQCHDAAGSVGENQQIAAPQFPKICGAVLLGHAILCGHERFEAGQIGQEPGGMQHGELPLPLCILEVDHRTVKVLVYLGTYVTPHRASDDEQCGAGKPDEHEQ
jgi:hypothetical protein